MVNLDDLEVMLDNEGYSIKDKETIFSVVSTPFENKSYKQLISILCNDSGLHRIIIHNPNLLQAFNQEAIELPVGFMINLLTAGEEDGRFKAYQEEFSCQVDFDSKNDYSHITDSLVMKDEELESFNQKISEAEIEIERLKKENSLLEIQYKVRIDKYIKEWDIHKESKEKYIKEGLDLKRKLEEVEYDKIKAEAQHQVAVKDYYLLQSEFDKIKLTNNVSQRIIDTLTSEIINLKRKVNILHQCLFDKPNEIVKLLKTDGLLLSYLDRVYQKDLLNYK